MMTRCSGNPPPCATSASAPALHRSSPPPRAGSTSTSGGFPFASFTAAAVPAAAGDGAGRKHAVHRPPPLPAAASEELSASRSLATARGHREGWAPEAGLAARPIEPVPAAIIRRRGGCGSRRGRLYRPRRPRCGVWNRRLLVWSLLRREGGDPRERAGEEGQKLRGEQGKMTMIVLC